jgi:hypothetical protein
MHKYETFLSRSLITETESFRGWFCDRHVFLRPKRNYDTLTYEAVLFIDILERLHTTRLSVGLTSTDGPW